MWRHRIAGRSLLDLRNDWKRAAWQTNVTRSSSVDLATRLATAFQGARSERKALADGSDVLRMIMRDCTVGSWQIQALRPNCWGSTARNITSTSIRRRSPLRHSQQPEGRFLAPGPQSGVSLAPLAWPFRFTVLGERWWRAAREHQTIRGAAAEPGEAPHAPSTPP